MASDVNAFELLHDPLLEEMSTTAITRRSLIMSISLLPRRITSHNSSQLVAPGPLAVICKYHLKIEQDALTADTLRVFLEGYAKKSLEGHDYGLTFLATEVKYKMELSPMIELNICLANERM